MRSMMKQSPKYILKMTCGCLALLFLFSMMNGQVEINASNDLEQKPLNSALIDNSLITYNSITERVVGVLNVQVDLHIYGKTATKVNMTITFSNSTVQNITLSESPSDYWKGKYIPNPTAPLGAHTFKIISSDGTNYNVSNTRTFYIYSCTPKVGIMLSTTQLYRNNTLQYNITPSDGEDPVSKLSWTINVKTNSGTVLSTNSSSNGRFLMYWYRAESTYPDGNLGTCYVQVTVTDSDGNQTTNRAYFSILNNAPIVKDYTINFSDTSQTDPEDKELLRVSGIMTIKLNVSDIETTDYIDAVTNLKIKLRLYAIGPNNYKVDFASKIQRVADQPAEKAHFKCVSSVLKSVPAGSYKLYIVPYQDPVGGSPEVNSTITYDFTIVNNIPNATKIAYTINDLQPSSLGLSFQEYERLTFKINVTNCDAEGITYVKLCLLDAEGTWTNFTFQNPANNITTFHIRARDLEPGQWIAWVYAIDGDNVQVGTLNVISFDIIEDTFSTILPWLMLLIGIIAGFIVSFSIIGFRYLSLKNKRSLGDSESPDVEENVKSVKKIEKTKGIDSQKEKPKPKNSEQQIKTEPDQKTVTDGSKRQLMRKIEPKK